MKSWKKPSHGGGRAWHIRAALALASILGAVPAYAECGLTTKLNSQPTVEQAFLGCSSKATDGNDNTLQTVAFNLFGDLELREIKDKLVNQGFDCDGKLCRATFFSQQISKKTASNGTSSMSGILGPLRWKRTYELTFTATIVKARDQIHADYRFEMASDALNANTPHTSIYVIIDD